MVRLWAAMLMYLATLLIGGGFALAQEQLPLVNSIEVKGLKRIEEVAVKAKITQKIGEQLSNEKISEDIKNIFKMGYFDDVKTEIETLEGGIKVIYIVKEKPTVIRVEFQGNNEIKDDKLKEKTTITVGAIADTTLIQDNAGKLQLFYEEEGYWLAKIVPVINKVSESEVYLTYQIDEGKKVKIRNISIVGNKVISAGKIRGAMKTSAWKIYSFITSSGYYKKDTMNADLEAIKDLYFNNGFIKAVVSDPEIQLTPDKKGMSITIHVSEGDQYKISAVNLTGNKAFPEKELRKLISSAPGKVFSKEVLRKDIAAVTDLYTQNGYALANVFPEIVPEDAKKQLALTYKVEEGDIYRVGRIEISGNTKTRDKVIRREVRMDEGDIFNSALLKRSYERINNLNFFDAVDMAPKPRYEEKRLDIDIKVKEKATGFLSVGGGYSSVDKLIGMVDITQGNLFGRGQYLKLRGELGGRTSFYQLSFKDPWFMDKPISFTTDIYRTTKYYIDYSKKAIGFGFGFGKELSEYWGATLSYNIEKATIYNVSDTASSIITEQLGTKVTSSVSPSITRDSRDNYLDPSRGSRNSVYFTFAGLGGDNAFIKGLADSAWFFPVGSTTIALRGRLGYAKGVFNKALPLYERFCVGGIYTVRGLGYCQAGPKDDKGELIGGTKELIFNAEYIFPIFSELRLKGVVFADAGNAYDAAEPIGKLRYTTGGGFRWISPLGPIRIEWGYNIRKKEGESSSKIEFTFGSFF
ncbi:MAG: outer membrane protein assembly factor BamA [Nitrospirae bacterium]|nr:outer membrane protein assembly factor BamA [Nitrospirota bacterium]